MHVCIYEFTRGQLMKIIIRSFFLWLFTLHLLFLYLLLCLSLYRFCLSLFLFRLFFLRFSLVLWLLFLLLSSLQSVLSLKFLLKFLYVGNNNLGPTLHLDQFFYSFLLSLFCEWHPQVVNHSPEVLNIKLTHIPVMIDNVISNIWLFQEFFNIKFLLFFKLVFGLYFSSRGFLFFVFSIDGMYGFIIFDTLWNFGENWLLLYTLPEHAL